MTHIDPGTLGAKRQSWRHGNPRELLKRIIDELATTDRDRLFAEFTDQVFLPGNRPVLESVVEYWFTNNLNSLLEKSNMGSTRTLARARSRERTEQVSKEIVHQLTAVAGQMLLDLVLPHGKTLRETTGSECLAIGGWLNQIGARMKSEDTVGAIFSEEQLRKIFDQGGHRTT